MNKKAIPILAFIFFFFGILGVFRFSHDVRTVDVVGLFASGVIFGASLVALISAVKRKSDDQAGKA